MEGYREFINFRSFKIKVSKKCIIDIMVNELKRFFPRVGKEWPKKTRGNGLEKFDGNTLYYENGVETLY